MESDQIKEIYKKYRDEIKEVSLQIHANPELAEEETFAAAVQEEFLEKWGFAVQKRYMGLPTAFAARWGSKGPHICIMSEYDALPDIGHGCGHNLIAGVALSTGIMLKELIAKEGLEARITVMGTPAEEKRGCKVDLIEAGALKDVDLVLMAHPSNDATCQSTSSSGIMQYEVEFSGKESHAADCPEKGLNALDAVRMLFTAVDCWRQQLPETCRVHGIITHGGVAPNIIPGKASADFYLRSFSMTYLEYMEERFKDMVKGAALMTATSEEVKKIPHTYKPTRTFEVLNQAFMDLAEEEGMAPKWAEPERGSSDFGNVTYEVPGVQPYFNITDDEEDVVIHSRGFTKCAATEYGFSQMRKMSRTLVLLGCRYITDRSFQEAVKEEFQNMKG